MAHDDHMVSISASTNEDTLRYKVTLKSNLPVFYEGDSYCGYAWMKEAELYATPKRFSRVLGRKLRKAQKRYYQIVAFRRLEVTHTSSVNLEHKVERKWAWTKKSK